MKALITLTLLMLLAVSTVAAKGLDHDVAVSPTHPITTEQVQPASREEVLQATVSTDALQGGDKAIR